MEQNIEAGRNNVKRSVERDPPIQRGQEDRRRRITDMQVSKMRQYRRLGASERNISSWMGIPPATVHRYVSRIIPVSDQRPIQIDQKPRSATELGERAGSSVTTQTQPQTSKSPLPDAKTEIVYAAQNTNGQMGTLTLKWSPTLVWLISVETIRQSFIDPERWFREYAMPRMNAMAAAEEYIDIKIDPNDPAKGVKDWVDQFKFHMNNSLRYLQLQKARKNADYLKALETAGVDTELLRQIQDLE